MTAKTLSENWIHLGRDSSAEAQPPFDGMEWYGRYAETYSNDGSAARLVSSSRFSTNWKHWEMHPSGEEVVICTSDRITLIQEIDGTEVHAEIHAGQYVINPRGVWHTANVEGEAEAIFITAGQGTEHRARAE